MKKGVLKFTACALAAGMTISGTGFVSFAAKDTALAGFGVESVQGTDAAQETENVQTETENPETDTAETDAPAESTESADTQDTEGTDAAEAEEPTGIVLDTSMNGEIAFAQCEEYINVRSGADTESEVVGKVYNNGSVTIIGQYGEWYKVRSGNAEGYVNSAYFATGEQAEAIAEEVAYNVATVYPEALVVRAEPSEEGEQIGMAYSSDQLEVVAYEGDWMKVALGNDVYGYVNAYYVDYDTYYGTAETLEEEQARLDAEWEAYLAQQAAEQAAAEEAYLAQLAADQAAAEQAAADQAYQQQLAADQAAADAQAEAQAAADAQAQAEAEYQAYLDAQAEADAAAQQADEQAALDAAAQAQAEYQAYLDAQAAADAQAQAEADAAAQAQAEADAAAQAQAEADAAAQAQAEADAQAQAEADAQTQQTTTEDTSSSSSTLGQQIVNYAVQFVGNPYVWGGTSLTNGADCSGFTQSVFANFGISIPRTAASQSGSGTPVDLSEIQAGDLLFYSGDSGIGHVTIYMGNGQVVHASNSSTGIIISDYGYRTPVSARRYW